MSSSYQTMSYRAQPDPQSVSRRLVAATGTAQEQLTTRRPDGLAAFTVDGVCFGERTRVATLGVDVDGAGHLLVTAAGSARNVGPECQNEDKKVA